MSTVCTERLVVGPNVHTYIHSIVKYTPLCCHVMTVDFISCWRCLCLDFPPLCHPPWCHISSWHDSKTKLLLMNELVHQRLDGCSKLLCSHQQQIDEVPQPLYYPLPNVTGPVWNTYWSSGHLAVHIRFLIWFVSMVITLVCLLKIILPRKWDIASLFNFSVKIPSWFRNQLEMGPTWCPKRWKTMLLSKTQWFMCVI